MLITGFHTISEVETVTFKETEDPVYHEELASYVWSTVLGSWNNSQNNYEYLFYVDIHVCVHLLQPQVVWTFPLRQTTRQ